MSNEINTVKEYLQTIPEGHKSAVETIIRLIKESAPEITEQISHDMPFYTLDDEPLFAVASKEKHLVFYITERDILLRHKRSLGDPEFGSNSIRFEKLDELNIEAFKKLLEDAYHKRANR